LWPDFSIGRALMPPAAEVERFLSAFSLGREGLLVARAGSLMSSAHAPGRDHSTPRE
jgi:hypothetical protein